MFYEYKAKNEDKSCSFCRDIFEVRQSIHDEALTKCPECGNIIERQISLTAGFIVLGKEMNQYSDVKYAKYWRDKNGVRHKVTPSDGHSKAPTVSRRKTASPSEIQARIQRDRAVDQIKNRRNKK